MSDRGDQSVAIVGVGALLPDAPDAPAFWQNVRAKRYSISDVPPDRWSIEDYYDPDPAAPDKTYSKIGGWVRGFTFDWKRFRVPPTVAAAMDEGQQWAVTVAADALADYGWPGRPLDLERTGVVLGAAMGGERHYLTTLRIMFPEFRHALDGVDAFRALPPDVRAGIIERWHDAVGRALPPITEDSMPGELPNIISGRVANILNLRGPNFITDAACASSFAALEAAIELLQVGECDAVLTGGVDRNMGASTFVKFCKIGALSATGTRPFGDGADGFVMGEGAAVFLVRRLADAVRDGDRIYAVVRGVGAASDGKGKGITAPNPVGQRLAIERAWRAAGLDPATATLVEAHGTSTKVGDVVEVESLSAIFAGAPAGSIALGSAKSNIGHLKAGAGAAGLLKAVYALHHRELPPTLHAERPNPGIEFARTPFAVNHELRPWEKNGTPRRAGVSAYGFGGTNFHVVLEEFADGSGSTGRTRKHEVTVDGPVSRTVMSSGTTGAGPLAKAPLRGLVLVGAPDVAALRAKVEALAARVGDGFVPAAAPPDLVDRLGTERVAIDFGDGAELFDRLKKTERALASDTAPAWRALAQQGIARGSGRPEGKVAFLFPGQGSQYVNMGKDLAGREPCVRRVFEEADAVLVPLVGRPLTSFLFADESDAVAMAAAEEQLRQTAITQPAVLTVDAAVLALLGEYGIAPDIVMGHSLGEYAALVAAGVMPLADALEASAARGREMTRVSLSDNGWMAAVMAPLEVIEKTLGEIDGYVVGANINSRGQAVIGGATSAVQRAMERFAALGFEAVRLPVSHAFHTRIVAPASGPLAAVLDRLRIAPPRLPVVGNVDGALYPRDVPSIKEHLVRQIASPVQWVRGLETLWSEGARTFVEVGPKKALRGFTDDVLGGREGLLSLFTNHPKTGGIVSFNQALAVLWAAGHGVADHAAETLATIESAPRRGAVTTDSPASTPALAIDPHGGSMHDMPSSNIAPVPDPLDGLGALLSRVLGSAAPRPFDRNARPEGSVVITGCGLGLPGAEKPVMDPTNVERILRGEQLIDLLPARFRDLMADKRVTRVVKSADGSGRFETIDDSADVLKLAGRPGSFDFVAEYGVPEKLVEALDYTTQLAMAAGIDALREAGIPLVQTWKRTSTGKHLPERWMLPESLRDETGVIFASAFPGMDRFADEARRYYTDSARRTERAHLDDLRRVTTDPATLREILRRIAELDDALLREPYAFDRRFLLRVLAMGHSQFAEFIGARGPNTQTNGACASTAQAIGIAEDWIRCGRCRRVVVVAADAGTSDNLMEWIGAGFLASGVGATDDKIEEAVLPFDRRRHGTVVGMGAAALVLESQDAVVERGMRAIVELLSTEVRNSAYHATRLDVDHVAETVESLVRSAEQRFGIDRRRIAPETVFISHETYTPARGGSASAEVAALRRVFGRAADEVVISNTKGFTGHPMGVGVEDVIGVKILETGIVPPVPNLREPDPDLGPINLSRGGRYPVAYAIHLAAGFGSQIALTLTRRVPGGIDRVDDRARYGAWLDAVTGCDRAELEVKQRVLRVVSRGVPSHRPAPSNWTFGHGPVVRVPYEAADARPLARTYADVRPAAPEVPVAAAARNPLVEAAEPAPAAAEPVRTVTQERPAPVAAAKPVPEPVAATDHVTARVLAIVAGKTGYPEDMLDLELDLEADLGVDTVKQAETFAAVREEWNIPRQENLRLRDFPTLRHVVDFVLAHRPDLKQAAPEQQPVAVVAAPAVAAAPPAPAAPAIDSVTARVLAIVAGKTGYPEDMLDLELDLEADLGVDTVKQAETFAAVREEWDIPRQENLRLRDFPTLRHVVDFVLAHRPDLRPGAAAAGVAPSVEPAPPAEPLAAPRSLDDADRLARRVVVPVLRPPLELCRATGVTLGEGVRVLVALDQGGAGAALVEALTARGVIAVTIDPAGDTDEVIARASAAAEDGPVAGVFWLPALDAEPPLASIDLPLFRELNRVRTKNLFHAVRALGDWPPGGFLVAATRMGGLHGHGTEGATAPLGGAVSGFCKAFSRECAGAVVKVVDVEADATAAVIASALVAEALSDPGAVEIGYHAGRRWSLGLEERPADDGRPGLALTKDTVCVVTGAAGGITSAIVDDLARAGGGTFWLLDVVTPPDRGDRHIALFREGRERLKAALIDEARAREERVTPVAIDREILAVERREAALRVVESVERAGGTAHWRAADLRDGAAVAAIVDEIRAAHGRIDVLVHAAGLEISHALADKEPREFDLVFDVKADGFMALLHAAEGLPIGATVTFGSVAGRFGNAGQTDYSAANALLASLSRHLRIARPGTRAITIDWTAWGGIGMATRGSIPKVMEAAGIDMLDPDTGIPTVRRELVRGGTADEIVVGGRLGILEAERDPAGGLDLEAIARSRRERHLELVGDVVGAFVQRGLVVETTLDPCAEPFLFDHRIDGTAVLPGVMGTEAFAEAATLLAPDLSVTAVSGIEFLRPFKFHRDRPATLHLAAVGRPGGNGTVDVRVVLTSTVQPRPEMPATTHEHFRATVHLGAPVPSPQVEAWGAAEGALAIGRDAIYRFYFHGPAFRVLDGVRLEEGRAVGLLHAGLPQSAADPEAASLVSPRLVELCFQTAGILEIAHRESFGLPTRLGRLTVYRPGDANGDRLEADVRETERGFDARVVDGQGNVYLELESYRTVALPGRHTLDELLVRPGEAA